MTSRHSTYRQSYTLILSPLNRSLCGTSSIRSTVGTTVHVKDLFANYPVRQSSSRSNHQSELTELHKITIGMGLSCPMTLTLRTHTGEKMIKIDCPQSKDWNRNVLEKSLNCSFSSWRILENQQDNVRIIVKVCLASTLRNYSFICTLSVFIPNVDVNGRYIHNHSLVEELKSNLSKVVGILDSAESDDLKSTILILRITTPPQSFLSLTQTVNNLLLRLTGSKGRERHSFRSLYDTPQIESKMKSARGVEYSKPTIPTAQKPELTVSIDNPGVEFNQRVFPL